MDEKKYIFWRKNKKVSTKISSLKVILSQIDEDFFLVIHEAHINTCTKFQRYSIFS